VGLVAAAPAEAQAPYLTQAQKIKIMSPKEYAAMKVESKWLNPKREFRCLHDLWMKESNWRPNAHNKSSGAWGIAQFLPSTWGNYKFPFKPKDPQIQIDAGLRYIYKRYGTPMQCLGLLETSKQGLTYTEVGIDEHGLTLWPTFAR
jgi:hypothetical protein